MPDHFMIASYARDCVVAGDLESLRVPLETLASYRYPTVAPGPWLEGASAMQAAARLTAAATSIEAAAAGVATMARTCGDCHRAERAGPMVQPLHVDPDPEAEDLPETLDRRMARHALGAEQLWLGLTVPSAAAWRAGALTIGDAPEPMLSELPKDLQDALSEIRTLGRAAAPLEAAEARAELYADLLATCADCHARALAHALE